jgi:hypothetical protein
MQSVLPGATESRRKINVSVVLIESLKSRRIGIDSEKEEAGPRQNSADR